MNVDREQILELLALLKDSPVAELEVTDGDTRIRLVRFAPAPNPAQPPQEAGATPAPASPAAAGSGRQPTGEVMVRAHVVGLFFLEPKPGDPPLIKVGDTVQEGQNLGIIEVLRKPTYVLSPVHGVVVDVLAQEGEGVQYGDPLFLLRAGV